MNSNEIKQIEKEHIMQTYGRFDVVIEKGKGIYVFDKEGKKYLDFLGGIATCSVGHGNKDVTKAISKQASKLIGITNLYYTEEQAILAKKLSEISGLKYVFFCNSGAEANEAAIKLAKKITGKKEFIACEHSFHGRTTASLAATWKHKYREPFAPLMPEVKFAEYDNIESIKNAITENTAAILIEPIQGEAGIIPPSAGFLKNLRKVCDDNNVLLIFDEVQTGVGRTGKFFAYLHENIKPDIVTTAKGIGNGVPLGLCISDKSFEKGEHASTFGGNNLVCAAANATIDYIEKNNLMENAIEVGNYFMDKLNDLKKKKTLIKEVRGKGLMIGVVLNENKAKEIVDASLKAGLLLNAAADDVLRFLPPLIASKKDVDKCIKILKKVM